MVNGGEDVLSIESERRNKGKRKRRDEGEGKKAEQARKNTKKNE